MILLISLGLVDLALLGDLVIIFWGSLLPMLIAFLHHGLVAAVIESLLCSVAITDVSQLGNLRPFYFFAGSLELLLHL